MTCGDLPQVNTNSFYLYEILFKPIPSSVIQSVNTRMFRSFIPGVAALILSSPGFSQTISYPVVDTDVNDYSNHIELISAPVTGEPFYGQDASYQGNEPSYTDHGDGTVTDNVTGLTWEQDMGLKISCADAMIKADTMTLGGYDDWRVPTIKELYSLILFSGRVSGASAIDPFIDTTCFNQPLGNTDLGEREIDAQTWSSTQYTGLTMNGDSTVFGVNFVDGRIKGYPKYQPGSNNTAPRSMYFRMVRGNQLYGFNDFEDNGDGTISDHATALMWQQADDDQVYDWEGALSYAEALELGGYDDWRLPNAKELQSIVDYSRSPQSAGSPAIDPLFHTTSMTDPDGNPGQYPYFWSGTTHQDGPNPLSSAVYIAFGEAQGLMNDVLMDVHGAGSQRSDPKSGDMDAYPQYHGPQGDVRYVFNAVRCVRDMEVSETPIKVSDNQEFTFVYPNPATDFCMVHTAMGEAEYDLQMFDSTGRLLLRLDHLIDETISIDLGERNEGVYIICLAADKEYKTLKVIKQ